MDDRSLRTSTPSRAFTAAVSALLATAALAGCAPAHDGPAATVAAGWATLDGSDQLAALAAAERRIDRHLAHSVGLDVYLGVSADDAALQLPRVPGPIVGAGGAPGRAGTARVDDSGATAAAANGFSMLDGILHDGLGKAAESDDGTAEGRSAEGADQQFDWGVENGEIAGTFSDTISSTADGASLTMTVEGEFLIGACPDADGRTAGELTVQAGVELDSSDPRMVALSTYELGASIDTTVSDDALAVSTEMDVHSDLGDAQATPGADGSPQTSGYHVSSGAHLSFGYGERGAAGAADVRIDDATSSGAGTATDADIADFAAMQRDLAAMIAQRITKLAEDYWRDGNYVYVGTDPAESAALMPGDSLGIDALPYSRLDDALIEAGTMEGTLSGAGRLSPAGAQPVRTQFTYTAPSEPGATGTIEMTATSRRGIGRAPIEVAVVDGWVIDSTYEEVRTTATKCDGLLGEWSLDHTAPWGYRATTTFALDESLTALYRTTGTVDGQGFSGGGEIVLIEVADDEWELHASTGENVFPLLPAPPGTCT